MGNETTDHGRDSESFRGSGSGDAQAQSKKAEQIQLDFPSFSDLWSRNSGMSVENVKRVRALKRGVSPFRRVPTLKTFRFNKGALGGG